jgi:hypothetical protein
MKLVIVSCLSAGLAIAGNSPAAAVQCHLASVHAGYVAIADSDFAAKKDEYLRDAKREMQEWGDKLDRAGNHASKDVDRAWTKTKDAAHRLQVASATQWDRAQRGFEDAMQDLKARWHKIHPEDE